MNLNRGLTFAAVLALVGFIVWRFWDSISQMFSSGVSAAASGVDAVAGGVSSMLTKDAWVKAFSGTEGGKPNDKNIRYNNPGNLRPPNRNPSFWNGQTGVDEAGIAIFDSWDNGVRALLMNIRLKATAHPTWTLTNLGANWLGNSDPTRPEKTTEGDPFAYGENLARLLGVSITSKIGDLWKATV